MNIVKNKILDRNLQKPILLDYYHLKPANKIPVVIFAHGYKGFKDWGAWDLMGQAFANAGFCFIKFNFSHNGGTIDNPIDFPDLESFGNNNYSKEVQDLNDVIEWSTNQLSDLIDVNNIFLLGHSRAGGITTLVASQNDKVKKLITLAGVSDYKTRFPTGKALNKWKIDKVFYVKNGRTQQEMPHYYQFFEDFIYNEEKLTIKIAAQKLTIPHLIIHGQNDDTVNLQEGRQLHKWNKNSQLHIIREANHTLGAVHPWSSIYLPKHLKQAIQCSINFYKK